MKKDRIFKAHENPAKEIVTFQNEEVIVSISYTDDISFTITTIINAKMHTKTFPPLASKEKQFSSKDIVFDSIEFNHIEKTKIASRLNEIVDHIFS